jgi:LAO/AO transport system kinase
VVVETVGVGQSEVEVAGQADTTLVLLAPGMGDGIQAAKAGILEVGDVFVVNKADRDGAHQVVRELRGMLALSERAPHDWRPPILETVAVQAQGIDEVAAAVAAHGDWLDASGQRLQRRLRRVQDEIEAIAVASLRARFATVGGQTDLGVLAAAVVAGTTDAYTAADEVVRASTSP